MSHRFFGPLLAILVFGGAALAYAQDLATPAPPKIAPPQAASQDSPAQPDALDATDLGDELQALLAAFKETRQLMRKGEKTREELLAFMPKFQDLAKRAEGSDLDLKALLGLWEATQRIPLKTAAVRAGMKHVVEAMTARHLHAPELARIAPRLEYGSAYVGEELAMKSLRTMATESKDANVRAAAIHTIIRKHMRDSSGSAEKLAEAKKLLAVLLEQHPDTSFAERAKGYGFALDNLQIGCTAPDIEGADQRGETVKLSQFRGKVVVLYFWGFW